MVSVSELIQDIPRIAVLKKGLDVQDIPQRLWRAWNEFARNGTTFDGIQLPFEQNAALSQMLILDPNEWSISVNDACEIWRALEQATADAHHNFHPRVVEMFTVLSECQQIA